MAEFRNPTTGTFASLDPVLEKASPLELNGYAYAGLIPSVTATPPG